MLAEKLFSSDELQEIRNAIASAERASSGEIRLFLEDHCTTDTLDRASHIFDELKVKNTLLRNGVLIYIAVDDRRFCIIGDAGIHQKVGDKFWDGIRDQMQLDFQQENFKSGLIRAITVIGEKLVLLFPLSDAANINELPDDIVFGR